MYTMVYVLLGCDTGATPMEGVPAVPENEPATAAEQADPLAAASSHHLTGEVSAIRMQNINKAAGKYTYNVELDVRVSSLEPASAGTPPLLPVRLEKVYWGRLTETERRALSPSGPAPNLSPQAWAGYAVGQAVSINVALLSPDLAHLVPIP